MAWSPVITSHFGRKVALNPTAISTALARDISNGVSFVHAHDPILVTIYKDDDGYEVSESGNSVNPHKVGRYKGAPVTIYAVKFRSKQEAITEFITLVRSPLKFAAKKTIGTGVIVPPRPRK